MDGVHEVLDYEDWCVVTETDQISGTQVRQALNPILEHADGWQATPPGPAFPGAVDFVMHSSECNAFHEIEVHVWDDVVADGACSQGAAACAGCEHISGSHGGYDDCDKVHVNFSWDRVAWEDPLDGTAARWRTDANHEFGHVLGLSNPVEAPRPITKDGEGCKIIINIDPLPGLGHGPIGQEIAPVLSIMHTRICVNVGMPPLLSEIEWPTLFDLISVHQNVVPLS